jgi:hypothetical protein
MENACFRRGKKMSDSGINGEVLLARESLLTGVNLSVCVNVINYGKIQGEKSHVYFYL